MVSTVYEIPSYNYEWLEKKIEKLSKKSMKISGQPITMMAIGSREERQQKGFVQKIYEVFISAPEVKIEGWEVLAGLGHISDKGSIIREFPNVVVDIPEEYKTSPQRCDHCNIKRNRKDTFIIRHTETGEFKQVGRNCLSDFIGHDVDYIAKMAALMLSITDSVQYSMQNVENYRNDLIDLEYYLQAVAMTVRTEGRFVTRREARDGMHYASTADEALFNLRTNVAKISKEDEELAERALNWVNSLTDEQVEGNDYFHNIRLLAQTGVIEERYIGLAASILNAYSKSEEVKEKRENERKRLESSVFQGTVGQRLTLNVEVIYTRYVESYFGTSLLVKMVDEASNVYTTFASGRFNVDKGEKLTVRGTVKDHNEFNGVNETILNRVARVEK